jgi:hypothetical protein
MTLSKMILDHNPPDQPVLIVYLIRTNISTIHRLSAPLLTQQELLLNLGLNTFDAVNRIHNISPTISSEAYRFVPFDVTSLFTNIPLHEI